MEESTTSTDFLDKLKKALSRDGDFPASARVVSELRELISKPDTTTNQVAEIILREPSLGTRVLALVNSSLYKRAKPILTVSQAVVQIGMRPLAELCSGLILLQKFIPTARNGGPFATCLKRTIASSILTSSLTASINSPKSKNTEKGKIVKDEGGYLAGSFAEMGTLLLAYYFPKLYESAEKRALSKSLPLARSIKELVGLSPLEISKAVMLELKLPQSYIDSIEQSEKLIKGDGSSANTAPAGQALFAGLTLSAAISDDGSAEAIEKAILHINNKVSIDTTQISDALGNLVQAFQDYCSALDLKLPPMPEELKKFKELQNHQDDPVEEAVSSPLTEEERFADFVEEIRIAVDNREPTASVITTVMETFAWSLGFDRVLLMLLAQGKQKLQGRMLLGNIPNFNPKQLIRPVGSDAPALAPDALALKEGRPIYRGDPLFDEGWPFTALPVGFDKRCVGVLYADRTQSKTNELSSREQAAISMLAELLDRSISMNS
jgi:HD-like signal output (HDOD) protein